MFIHNYMFFRCYIYSNPERCTDIFGVMLKLECVWVGQNQSEHCFEFRSPYVKMDCPLGLYLASIIKH